MSIRVKDLTPGQVFSFAENLYVVVEMLPGHVSLVNKDYIVVVRLTDAGFGPAFHTAMFGKDDEADALVVDV